MGRALWLSCNAVELARCFEAGELTNDLEGGVSVEERGDCTRESRGLDFVACNDRSSSDIVYNPTLASKTGLHIILLVLTLFDF